MAVVENHVCEEGRFQCDNGICVYIGGLCDGYEACADGSDEHNCGALKRERGGDT